MLKIRLQRVGRKHDPRFRIVVTDSKNSPKSGKFLEVLGSYDPRKSDEVIKEDKIKHWISKGAEVSGTVNNLLISKGVIQGKKVNVLPKKQPIKKDQPEAPAVKTETPEAVPESSAAEEKVEEAPTA